MLLPHMTNPRATILIFTYAGLDRAFRRVGDGFSFHLLFGYFIALTWMEMAFVPTLLHHVSSSTISSADRKMVTTCKSAAWFAFSCSLG